ncbi:MAG TPA: glucokinase, partial [Chromatiales bacterium]|nr:glucokinase [Chromatiales bacterium]
EPVAAACFGIAGPVRDNVSQATNLPWHIDAGELEREFEFGRVSLLNDLEATGWGIRALRADDIFELHPGRPDPRGNAAIIAAGTGLGEAALCFDGHGHRPFATEGGHADFSPNSDQEIELLRYLKRKYRHVSWERVVSGPGLLHIHDFLRHITRCETPGWLAETMQTSDPSAAIARAAEDRRDVVCAEAMELFVHLYGVEAGNLALKQMATGGLYIGGGIAPKILPWMKAGGFLDALLSKGRMRPLLEQMPVRIILNDRTALFGPALYAAAHRP